MKNYFFLFIFLLVNTSLLAQPLVYHSATPEDEIIYNVIEDDNGNFFCVGGVGNYFDEISDGLILKLDSKGRFVKSKRIFAENNYGLLGNVVQLDDKSFIAVGSVLESGHSHRNIWVLNFDAELNILWEQKMGSVLFHEYPQKIRFSKDNNLLIVGTAINSNPFNSDVF